MREDRAIAAFPPRKGVKKLEDALAKIDGQRQNRPELDDDRVHLPETNMQIDFQQRFRDAQMRR